MHRIYARSSHSILAFQLRFSELVWPVKLSCVPVGVEKNRDMIRQRLRTYQENSDQPNDFATRQTTYSGSGVLDEHEISARRSQREYDHRKLGLDGSLVIHCREAAGGIKRVAAA
jgi:hypothetical protein